MRRKRAKARFVVLSEQPVKKQYGAGKKYRFSIHVGFDRHLKSVTAQRYGALNRLLLLTEGDRLYFGTQFVTISTDDPHRYNRIQLVGLIAECYGFEVTETTIITE